MIVDFPDKNPQYLHTYSHHRQEIEITFLTRGPEQQIIDNHHPDLDLLSGTEQVHLWEINLFLYHVVMYHHALQRQYWTFIEDFLLEIDSGEALFSDQEGSHRLEFAFMKEKIPDRHEMKYE